MKRKPQHDFVCPVCLCWYSEGSGKRAGQKCGDCSGFQKNNCPGRLIPEQEWNARVLPHDFGWAECVSEGLVRTARFGTPEGQRDILDAMIGIMRGIARFGLSTDLVKASDVHFTFDLLHLLAESAYEAELKIHQDRLPPKAVH